LLRFSTQVLFDVMIAAISFKVDENCEALIYAAGDYGKIDWHNPKTCELGDAYKQYQYEDDNSPVVGMDISRGVDDCAILRLTETKRYTVSLEKFGNSTVQVPILQNQNNKSLKYEKDRDSVSFQYVNYLGRSRMTFGGENHNFVLQFEVVPDKISYEEDYIKLTEALAERCSELLLDHAGATSNLFSQSADDSRTLLEQFIFLRCFCYSENIAGLFEAIKRNPDRILIEDVEFKPIGCGMPSKKVFTHPFSYTRNWQKVKDENGGNHYYPELVAVAHKKNNLDTTANRFLKFALEKFLYICEELIHQLSDLGTSGQSECLKEATAIAEAVNDILQDDFFDEIGTLDIMPQNNQVLQKREGYSQIFSAYSMVDLALQLDWKGEEAVFDGESKDVALLYEYWLFFELIRIMKSIDGCEEVTVEDNAFLVIDDGKLCISLQQGKPSCQAFKIDRLRTKVNLYYNRSFTPTEFKSTRYEGSYSRTFRPDYTLAIFPDSYDGGKDSGEYKALKDGAVSYIHFDAKYRITDISKMIGSDSKDDESELAEEKNDEITNTYKRGDLLKMHTYNDAIRRTIGSYVLYPGDTDIKGSGNKVFSLYDEILPGVGAFSIKPSISELGESEIKKFVVALINEKGQNHSRLNRLKYYAEMVLQEPAASTAKTTAVHENTNISDSLCVLGYIRATTDDDYYYSLLNNNKLKEGSEFLFYYYAIKDKVVFTHHPDIAKAGLFRFYTNDLSVDSKYCLAPILCSIESSELMSKENLIEKLNDQGYKTTSEDHKADFYYVLKVKVIDSSCPDIELPIDVVESKNGNDSFSKHSPKVILKEW